MNLDPESLNILSEAAAKLTQGFQHLPDVQSRDAASRSSEILNQVATALAEDYPYHHPFYLGQMLKPPDPLPQLAYTLAMCLNPNNHALDGGRASSVMERDVVKELAAMVGWSEALGHLCSGGTIANLEALWVAREVTHGRTIVASSQAHYTHGRCCEVLQAPFQSVPCTSAARMDINCLRQLLEQGDIGTVVATLGTTGLGAVDALDEILSLREKYQFRLHVDAAYGGYFKFAENLSPETQRQYDLMAEADSIVIDPHKHGLQPYGCGCVLFNDPSVASVYKHDSPYTYFTSEELHLGEISLECSRPGAAAVALWATLQRFPLSKGGEFAQRLEASRRAALKLAAWLDLQERFRLITKPELDIVVWLVTASSASQSSKRAQEFFDAAEEEDLHLALLKVPRFIAEATTGISDWDQETVTCLRACLMKPEHDLWMPQILDKLAAVSAAFS